MSNRPDIALALDVRSNETVAVISDPETPRDYPKEWVRVSSRRDLDLVTHESVVLIDRIDVPRKALMALALRSPRLLALFPNGIEQEKSMRRLLSAMYPWSEVWTISTSFGKALVTKDVVGHPYDPDAVLDARPQAEA